MSSTPVTFSLVLQATHDQVEVGLYSNGITECAYSSEKNRNISRFLVLNIVHMLKMHDADIAQLHYIVVNQGPAPFTTLRVLLAVCNGISFATRVPLVGIDGLALFMQTYAPVMRKTVALFNAFNRDVYVAHNLADSHISQGTVLSLNQLIDFLQQEGATGPVRCIGNGALLYQQQLQQSLGENIILDHEVPQALTLSQLAQAAYNTWNAEYLPTHMLQPLYTKAMHYKAALEIF